MPAVFSIILCALFANFPKPFKYCMSFAVQPVTVIVVIFALLTDV